MEPKAVESHYPTVVNSTIGRLMAADQLLSQIDADKEHTDNWLRLDAVALQVRKVCELVVLGSTLAHLQNGTELDPKHWHPKDAFKEIEKYNQYPLPLPLHLYLSVDDEGAKQFVPAMKPMTLAALNSVYGQCANILHVPSAHKVLEEKVVPFEWQKYRTWVNDFIRLMRAHALLMPNIQSVVICQWTGAANVEPNIVLAEGIGEAALNTDGMADFSLLQS